MPQPQQSLRYHARLVPLFHFALFALVAGNFFHAARTLLPLSQDSFWRMVVAAALVLMMWYVRAFPLAAQDRVIRLEERLRLAEMAPELAVQAGRITSEQWTALRFAGDGEFVELVRRVLDGKLTSPRDIKRAIVHWRADHERV
jgi:hypothetical protein